MTDWSLRSASPRAAARNTFGDRVFNVLRRLTYERGFRGSAAFQTIKFIRADRRAPPKPEDRSERVACEFYPRPLIPFSLPLRDQDIIFSNRSKELAWDYLSRVICGRIFHHDLTGGFF